MNPDKIKDEVLMEYAPKLLKLKPWEHIVYFWDIGSWILYKKTDRLSKALENKRMGGGDDILTEKGL